MKYYDSDEMGFGTQNFCAQKDANGIMLFGSSNGLLEYDGANWRQIETPNSLPIFSMDIAPDGTVYVGGFGWFGYLVTDSLGRRDFVILDAKMDGLSLKFGRVHETCVVGSTVWFRTDETLFFWDGKKVGALFADGRFQHSWVVRDRLYVPVKDEGLFVVQQENKLEKLPGSEFLIRDDNAVVFVRSQGQSGLLVGTANGSAYLYDGTNWKHAWDIQLEDAEALHLEPGINLPQGQIALRTMKSGAIVIDSLGSIVFYLDRSKGLGDERVQTMYHDGGQYLWIMLDNGLAVVEWPAPLTVFRSQQGLSGEVVMSERYRGSLYVATLAGVFRLIKAESPHKTLSDTEARFENVNAIKGACFDLLATKHGLLIADVNFGTFLLTTAQNVRKISARKAQRFLSLTPDGNTVLVASDNGLFILSWNGSGWTEHPFIYQRDNMKVRDMGRDAEGIVWVTHIHREVQLLDFTKGFSSPDIKTLDSSRGVPQGGLLCVPVQGVMRIVSADSLCRYDRKSNRLVEDSMFKQLLKRKLKRNPVYLKADQYGRLWLQDGYYGYMFLCTPDGSGKYDLSSTPFSGLPTDALTSISVEKDGTAWFASLNHLYRYDPKVEVSEQGNFRAFIREISTVDRILYHGNVPIDTTQVVELPNDDPSISIRFASNYYGVNNVLYNWRLRGYDSAWSDWSSNNRRVYTHLPVGEYVFEVMAERPGGEESPTVMYRFVVLPPWYRTWWAYLLFAAGFLFLLWIARLWYKGRVLHIRSKELEQTVQERTKEIAKQSEEIRLQAEELERVDAIVRTVNRETRLGSVLEALLVQSLQFFPKADIAMFVRRTHESEVFKVIHATGKHTSQVQGLKMVLREILGGADVGMQRMQEGVYLLSGLGEVIAERSRDSALRAVRFMAMSVQREKTIEGFLVLGSRDTQSFSEDDLQRLLRLKEHASSAVAKANALEELEMKNRELDSANHQLISTQEQLVAQKKIAALGELTAGIAHEIQNPLNFVNNFSELSCELLHELEQELQHVEGARKKSMLKHIEMIKANCEHIRQHGQRATSIVNAMIMHSRSSRSSREPIMLNSLLDEFVLLSYHGMCLLFPQFKLDLQTSYDETVGEVAVVPQEFSRVIVNICNNAWEAAILRAAEDGEEFKPAVHIRSERSDGAVRVYVRDNGHGVDPVVLDRIFEPFFTTKESSRNAGLGLSMSHEIITQLHRGEITVRTEPGAYTEFCIQLPLT
ncbi:hypothetical protein KQI65_09930 [bacterium]|nr:hypothetical protein [bacterium]